MSEIKNHYDAVIVGGGMVGAAVALGLAQAGWSIAVIEHDMPKPFSPDAAPDVRVSAIGYASVQLLKRLNAWSDVKAMRAAPYRRLETWEWENAHIAFDAKDLGVSELGFMVENRIIQLGIWQQFTSQPDLTLLCPAVLREMHRNEGGWQLTLDDGLCLQTPLVIGADGANSMVRQFAGIGLQGWQYRQSCMLITIKANEPQQATTWQQFFPSGPRAFLPLFDEWGSLAWYDTPAKIRMLSTISLPQLNQEIARSFPTRLGATEVVSRGAFALTRRHATQYVKSGVVLLGDAAHTINPLAGQGVNLGYRDVETLLDVLIAARDRGENWGDEAVLKRYQNRRMPDNLLMQSGMDFFYKTFSNALPPVRFGRNIALMLAQKSGPLKNQVLKYALGL